MPGSPATSPNFGAARYADSDDATFSTQVNSVTDTFDALAVRRDDSRLSDQRTPLDGSVTTAKLADGAVTSAKLAAQTITQANIAAGTIGSTEIGDGAIQTVDLADGAVALGKLALNAVSTGALGDGVVTLAKLAQAVAQALAAPGMLTQSASASAPAGWLVCDGAAVSRAQYAALFAAIGVVWGTGDGSTTFNVPDLRGRTLIGVGTGAGLSARALAGVGGEEAHRLAVGELPGHSHGFNATTGSDSPDHSHSGTTAGDYPDHSHNGPLNNSPFLMAYDTSGNIHLAGGTAFYGQTTRGLSGATARHQHDFGTGGAIGRHQHGVAGTTDGGSGGGAQHNTLPPFAVVTVLIKT